MIGRLLGRLNRRLGIVAGPEESAMLAACDRLLDAQDEWRRDPSPASRARVEAARAAYHQAWDVFEASRKESRS